MKRLGKWLFNGLAAISLLLFLVTVLLWVRSYFGDSRGWVRQLGGEICQIGMSKKGILLYVRPDTPGVAGINSQYDILDLRLERGMKGGRPFFLLMLPLWFPTVIFVLLPAICFARWYRKRAAVKGRCAACGYDLRATPDRCPECGTPSPSNPKPPFPHLARREHTPGNAGQSPPVQ
jgi:hypothetical protein